MPKRKQPDSLEGLAVRQVALAVRRTCTRIDSAEEDCTKLVAHLETFAQELPSPILEKLFHEVLEEFITRLQDNRNDKGLLAALNGMLQPNLKVADLGSTFVKVRLSRGLSSRYSHLLPSCIARMSLLTRLNLCSRCCDQTLEAIASNCPNLIYLNISYSDLVTDMGLYSLAGSGVGSGCLKLKYIGLIKLWDVTAKGIAALVERLPDLLFLHYDRCGDMIEHMKDSDKQQPLCLRNFDQSYYIYNPSYEQVAYIASVCPEITNLCLYVADDSLPLFSALSKVQTVEIEFDGAAGSGLESWLACSGQQIINLSLTFETLTWRQLEMICRHCPRLKTMRLLGTEIVWDEGAEMMVQCPALQQLRLSIWADSGLKEYFLSWVLKSARHTLSVMTLEAVMLFLNDQYLVDLFMKYPMQRLEELALNGARKGDLTVGSARIISYLCPELKKLVGFSSKPFERDAFVKEMSEQNYDFCFVDNT